MNLSAVQPASQPASLHSPASPASVLRFRKRWTVRKRGIHGVSLRVCTGEWLKVIISYFHDPTRKEEGTISVFVNAVYCATQYQCFRREEARLSVEYFCEHFSVAVFRV